MKTTSVTENKQIIDEFIDISSVADFMDQAMFTRIMKKLIDYTEIISENKLSSIINHTYNLSNDQILTIIEFLIHITALSRIYTIAQKGSRDLEPEYISNIFSNPYNLENSSAYISIRNAMEIRLTHQIQQFNINMGITNIAKSVPVSTLRGQVKTYHSMPSNRASSKVQHGYITASLHDAYVLLIPRVDFWNDKTYTKFFFNEDTRGNNKVFIANEYEKKTLTRLNRELEQLQNDFDTLRKDIIDKDITTQTETSNISDVHLNREEENGQDSHMVFKKKYPPTNNPAHDPTMQTPFGVKYGTKINSILNDISAKSTNAPLNTESVNATANILSILFERFRTRQNNAFERSSSDDIIKAVDFIIFLDMDMRNFSENFLYKDRKETFIKFYQDNSAMLETFLLSLFETYFNHRFEPILKYIKTDEMLKFACAFIIKRIYFVFGESLTIFGFFLIKSILKIGKLQQNG